MLAGIQGQVTRAEGQSLNRAFAFRARKFLAPDHARGLMLKKDEKKSMEGEKTVENLCKDLCNISRTLQFFSSCMEANCIPKEERYLYINEKIFCALWNLKVASLFDKIQAVHLTAKKGNYMENYIKILTAPK